MEYVYRVRSAQEYSKVEFFHDEYEAKRAIEDYKAQGIATELSPIPLPENKKQFVAFLEGYRI